MAITPDDIGEMVLFNGAPVKSIGSKLGFNTSPSTLDITVVNDPEEGNVFTIPSMGEYFNFEIGELKFGGLVTNMDTGLSTGGSGQFAVNMSDPREIMQSISLIITPTTSGIQDELNLRGVHNILDVWQYFNSRRKFGDASTINAVYNDSRYNAAGMPSTSIQDSINDTVFEIFGESYKFNIDLPNATIENRLDGFSVNINDFVDEMATIGAYDWYIESVKKDGVVNVEIKTIDRSEENIDIDMQTFLDSFPNLINSFGSGVELRNDTSSVVLQGDYVDYLLSVNVRQPGDNANNIIGFYSQFDLITNRGTLAKEVELAVRGNEFGDEPHELGNMFSSIKKRLTVDLSQVKSSWTSQYYPDILEMRYALKSFEAWWFYIAVDEGKDKAPWSDEPISHSLAPGNVFENLLVDTIKLKEKHKTKSPIRLNMVNTSTGKLAITLGDSNQSNDQSELWNQMKAAYDLISAHANEHFGTTFFYTPNGEEEVGSAWTFDGPFSINGNDDANQYFWSEFGATTAYVEFSQGGTYQKSSSSLEEKAITKKALKDAEDAKVTQDFSKQDKNAAIDQAQKDFDSARTVTKTLIGSIQPSTVDLSNFSSDDILWITAAQQIGPLGNIFEEIQPSKTSLYVRASAQDGILTIPSPVILNTETNYGADDAEFKRLIALVLAANPQDESIDEDIEKSQKKLDDAIKDEDDEAATEAKKDLDAFKKQKADSDREFAELVRKVVMDVIDNPQGAIRPIEDVFTPIRAYVPVKSRTLRWGPFFSDKAGQGKIELINDDKFNPRTFFSYTLMVNSAEERVKDGGSTVTELQDASVTSAGVPLYNLGASVGKNSNITDISMSFSDVGVKTTTQLKSFEERLAKKKEPDIFILGSNTSKPVPKEANGGSSTSIDTPKKPKTPPKPHYDAKEFSSKKGSYDVTMERVSRPDGSEKPPKDDGTNIGDRYFNQDPETGEQTKKH